MSNFKEFSKLIEKIEGKYQNTPKDQSGNTNSLGLMIGTNFGISARVYEQFIGHPPTIEEMKNMPKESALKIYEAEYFNKNSLGEISDQRLANIIGDSIVNGGKTGIQMTQERLYMMGYDVPQLSKNESLSNESVQALNSMDETQKLNFINSFSADRIEYTKG